MARQPTRLFHRVSGDQSSSLQPFGDAGPPFATVGVLCPQIRGCVIESCTASRTCQERVDEPQRVPLDYDVRAFSDYGNNLLHFKKYYTDASEVTMDLASLCRWSESAAVDIVRSFVTFHLPCLYKIDDGDAGDLTTALIQLLPSCVDQDEKLVVLSTITESLQKSTANPTTLALAVDKLQECHRSIGLPIPSKVELKAELKRRSDPHRDERKPGSSLPREIDPETFLEQSCCGELKSPGGYAVSGIGISLNSVIISETPVIIDSILVDATTGSERFELLFRRGDRVCRTEISAKEAFSRHVVHDLAQFGVDVSRSLSA